MAWARFGARINASAALTKTAKSACSDFANYNLGISGAWLYDSVMAMVTPNNKGKNNETKKPIYMFHTRHWLPSNRRASSDLLP
jgi:L-asparaginase/Glu-tRNA(Gln) amidotransferase subunit D